MNVALSLVAATLWLCEPFFDTESELYGFLDCDGEIAVAAKYRSAWKFTDGGIAAVLDRNGWHYISRTGDFVIRPMMYDNGPDYFSEGLARYVESGKYGFFDIAGRVVIEAQYDFAFPFGEGRAKVGEDCRFVPNGEHTAVECERWTFVEKPRAINGAE